MSISGFCSSVARTIGHFGSPKIIGGLSVGVLGSCFLAETPAVARVRNYALGMLAVSTAIWATAKYFGSSNQPSAALANEPKPPEQRPGPSQQSDFQSAIPAPVSSVSSAAPSVPVPVVAHMQPEQHPAPRQQSAPKSAIPALESSTPSVAPSVQLPAQFLTTDYGMPTDIKYTPGSYTVFPDGITKSGGDKGFVDDIKSAYTSMLFSSQTPIVMMHPLGINPKVEPANRDEDLKHNDGLTFEEGIKLAHETIHSFSDKSKRVVLLFDTYKQKARADKIISGLKA